MASKSLRLIVTNGFSKGQQFDIPFDNTMKFSDLATFLRNKFGSRDVKVHIDETGRKSLSTHSMKMIGNTLLSTVVLPSLRIPLSVTEYGPEISLLLKGTDSEAPPVVVRVHDTDTMEVLNAVVESAMGVPVSQQILKVPGHLNQTLKGDVLRDIGIKDYSNIEVSVGLKGGRSSGAAQSSVSMVDVFNQNAQYDVGIFYGNGHQWDAIGNGLSIEGTCGTRTCKAFGRRVTSPHGFGIFSLLRAQPSCPACKKTIRASNLGFSNCFYSIRGVEAGTSVDNFVSWTKVGEVYRTWDPRTAGNRTFQLIQVVVRSLKSGHSVPGNRNIPEAPLASQCCICFRDVLRSQQMEMLSCCHSFHKHCWIDWRRHEQREGRSAKCPICT